MCDSSEDSMWPQCQHNKKPRPDDSHVDHLVNCFCGGAASIRRAALFGTYVVCLTCQKKTKVKGMAQDSIDSWNFDGFNS